MSIFQDPSPSETQNFPSLFNQTSSKGNILKSISRIGHGGAARLLTLVLVPLNVGCSNRHVSVSELVARMNRWPSVDFRPRKCVKRIQFPLLEIHYLKGVNSLKGSFLRISLQSLSDKKVLCIGLAGDSFSPLAHVNRRRRLVRSSHRNNRSFLADRNRLMRASLEKEGERKYFALHLLTFDLTCS